MMWSVKVLVQIPALKISADLMPVRQRLMASPARKEVAVVGLYPKILILLLLIIAPPLTQTGCWDQQEVEKMGIVLTTALDQAPDGRVRLTAQPPVFIFLYEKSAPA